MAGRLRLALDQNFPTPLINAVRPYLPPELELASLREIDPALSDLDDRSLIVALARRGWDALITNNYKMLDVPEEIGAIISTKLTVIAVVGLGHDPLRAVGALLAELPALVTRIRAGRSNVFKLAYRSRDPEDGWEYLKRVAERRSVTAQEMWEQVRVSADELEDS